jgi:hypothetical protein
MRRSFRPQQSGGHNKLYPSDANVVDKAADEKSSGKKRIGLERGDVDRHSFVRVSDSQFVRGSTQPIIIVFIEGMIFRSVEKRLTAKTSLRWVRVSITVMRFASVRLKLNFFRFSLSLQRVCRLFSSLPDPVVPARLLLAGRPCRFAVSVIFARPSSAPWSPGD